ncbi:DUF1203 domain-containing protein [Luteimonas sp. R10]|uniref:DUF1203 domain-containing protein n=1 Tax=Luteimonas sp. R10 TaxID=3108176 RepID=UPI00308729CD|nr:DUF1203 domain-containing protein [Luteimonas sp. R10]
MTIRDGFRLTALPADTFAPLFALGPIALAERRIQRLTADGPGRFCRVGLDHVATGRDLLLLAYEHHPAASPYRASGPIFVGHGAVRADPAPGEIPEAMRPGLFAVKAYDARGDIVDADIAEGLALESRIARFLRRADAEFLHLHFARRGCYACRVERVD